MPLGHIGQIRRFPVKSLQGETLQRVDIDQRGVRGDRRWTVRERTGKVGSGWRTDRSVRIDGVAQLRAGYDGDTVTIALPDGREHRAGQSATDEHISRLLGRPVRVATDGDVSHVDEGPVHLVTTSAIAAVEEDSGVAFDWRRTRANLLITTPELVGFVEDQWVGQELRLGDEVVLTIRMRMPRCVIVNLPQEELPRDQRMLKAVTAANDAKLGVVADVECAGTVRVGDSVDLV